MIAQYMYGYLHVRNKSNRGKGGGMLELCCIKKIQKEITPITRRIILLKPKVAQMVKRLPTSQENRKLEPVHISQPVSKPVSHDHPSKTESTE